MKVNVFKFTDTKAGETFTGSIEDYYKRLNITKAALQSRIYCKRVSREWHRKSERFIGSLTARRNVR